MEELAPSHTLHRYEDPLASFEIFIHLDDIGVRNHADNQQLVSQELPLFMIKLDFVDLFDGAYFLCDFVSRVVDVGELTSTDSTDLLVDFGGGVESTVLAKIPDPVVEDLLVSMIHSACLESVSFGVK